MADVTLFWGGTGTQADAVAIPGIVNNTWLLFNSPSDSMTANGGALIASETGVTAVSGAFTTVTKIGAFAGLSVIADMYMYVSATGGTSDLEYYEIQSVDSDDVITVETVGTLEGGTLVTAETITFSVGGAGDISSNTGGDTDLQDQMDFIGVRLSGSHNFDILMNRDCTIDTTVDIDAISGSATTRVRVIGSDSDFEDDGTQVEITTTSTLANGLVKFFDESDYTLWKNFDFNGGGKDASRAVYGVFNPSTETSSIFHVFEECKFRGASNDGAIFRSGAQTFANCEFDLNGRYGINSFSGSSMVFESCVFSNNDNHGAFIDGPTSVFNHCIFPDNGGSGLNIDDGGDNARIDHCVFFGNAVSGLRLDILADKTVVVNCSSINNLGVGYDLDGDAIRPILLFRNNHSKDNLFVADKDGATSHCSETATLAAFLVFSSGSNITGDPLFTDFIPAAGSPLIDAGVGGTGDTIGALAATAGGAGGGVMPMTGLIS